MRSSRGGIQCWKKQLKKKASRRMKEGRQKWERRRVKKSFFRFSMAISFLIGVLIMGIAMLVYLKAEKNAKPEAVFSEMEKETEMIPKPNQPKYREIEILLEEHTITCEASSEARNHNLATAAEKINGCILQPEAWFEWSGVIGKTTAEKGYVYAPMILGGEPKSALGGGVCQVSSTLFSALWDAYIVKEGCYEAYMHSVPSKYINPEVDHEATVVMDYEPQKDLRVQNTLECPIKLYAWTDEGSVTVQVVALVYIKLEGQN